MAFAKWKNQNQDIVTVTVVTVATVEQKKELKSYKDSSSVTKVTTVTVTEGENEKVLTLVGDGDLPTLSAIGGGDNSVILANSISNEAANDHYESFVVSEVSTNGENLKPTTGNLTSEMSEVFPSSTHYPKSAVENIRLTQTEETYPPIVDGKHSQTEEVTLLNFMERYVHMVKCQQCEHLTDDGHCRVKPQYKPMPEAMRDCVSFDVLKTERISIVNAPYSATELNDLLSRYEKKLIHHLVDCVACSFMESRYCVDAFAIGSSYDAMLLVFDDAASKREALLNTVIRARISGRKVFIGIDYTNIGELPQTTVKPLVYGIGDSERPFVNHLMTCQRCKPANRTYCADGLKLKANA